jgi:glycosyltransferase involved in cell wall biosynthesis
MFTGYVTDSELFSLYKSALCLCMPSLWEGFGYPIVEAMGSHLPVVTSNNSSLFEIGNGCALFVDPYDEDQIAQTLKRVVTDENLRSELSKKGAERAKQFSGKIYYDKLVTILTKYS